MLALITFSGARAVPPLKLTVTSHGTGTITSWASSSEKGSPKILLLGTLNPFGSNWERSAIMGQ